MQRYYPASIIYTESLSLRELSDELGSFTASLIVRVLRKLAAMSLSDRDARAYLAATYPLLDTDKLIELYKALKRDQ